MKRARWLAVGILLLLVREQPPQEFGPFEVHASTMLQDVLPLPVWHDGPHFFPISYGMGSFRTPNCWLEDNPLKGVRPVMTMKTHPDDQYTSYIRTPYRVILVRGEKTYSEGTTRIFSSNVEAMLVKRCLESELGN